VIIIYLGAEKIAVPAIYIVRVGSEKVAFTLLMPTLLLILAEISETTEPVGKVNVK
jgi:hypothetical protein